MRYFLRDEVNVHYCDGKLSQLTLDNWEWNSEDPFGIFTSRMRREEIAFNKKKDQERRAELGDRLLRELDNRRNENKITEWQNCFIRPDRNRLGYTADNKPGKSEH